MKNDKIKCSICQDCINSCMFDENCYDKDGFHIVTGSYYRDDEDYEITNFIEDNTEG